MEIQGGVNFCFAFDRRTWGMVKSVAHIRRVDKKEFESSPEQEGDKNAHGGVILLDKCLDIEFERIWKLGMKKSASKLVLIERYLVQHRHKAVYKRDMEVGADGKIVFI